MLKVKVAFIGDGNMTYSLATGLVSNDDARWDILVSGHHPEKLEKMREEIGASICDTNLECVTDADVVVLSVKPEIGPEVLAEIGAVLEKNNALLVSILGATSLEQLFAGSDYKIPAVHCMPNVCSAVNAGVTSMYANELVTKQQKKLVTELFQKLGYAFWVATDQLTDSVAAVSGSGPAYFFFIIEILQNIAETFGLPKEIASQLARHTAKGAAEMATSSKEEIAALREMVTTPGGSTAEAIKTLEAGGVRALFLQALQNALYHHS